MAVVQKINKKKKIDYSVICDSCGKMVLNGETRAEKFIFKYAEEKGCKIFKTSMKVKCSDCQGENNRKPPWAR